VANVSHELRTPVAALRSVIETLADGAMDDRPVAEEFLRRADVEAERLVQLVEELLELSRIESGELPLSIKPTDVGALVQELVDRLRPIAERMRQKLTVELGQGLHDLPVDAGRIDRALVNLVQNAIKFTPEGGAISVKASHAGNGLKISVSDTGVGIAVSDLPRVFERFYKVEQSRASGGTGLGLALVKHAVEAHGGSVTAESRLGEGSTFTITIPLVEAQTRAPGELQQAPAVGTQL
jgi:two-component system phosphate regulon sensor histidine kinase PhoR